MALLITSFFAGILTITAPCVLPMLPVILGSTSTINGKKSNFTHGLTIIFALAVSIIVFTLLLKTTTLLFGIPQEIWQLLSGGIIITFGINLLFPILWEQIMLRTKLQDKSNLILNDASSKRGVLGNILIGASLGPVFSSCSPTYALIVATILPRSIAEGLIYLTIYTLGLTLILALIAYFGRCIVVKLGFLSNPNGKFKKFLGIILTTVGLAIILGLDKDFQAYVLENGWYDFIIRIESGLNL